jgi:hypothetical protein
VRLRRSGSALATGSTYRHDKRPHRRGDPTRPAEQAGPCLANPAGRCGVRPAAGDRRTGDRGDGAQHNGRLLYAVGNGESTGDYDSSDSVLALTPKLTLAGRFQPSAVGGRQRRRPRPRLDGPGGGRRASVRRRQARSRVCAGRRPARRNRRATRRAAGVCGLRRRQPSNAASRGEARSVEKPIYSANALASSIQVVTSCSESPTIRP